MRGRSRLGRRLTTAAALVIAAVVLAGCYQRDEGSDTAGHLPTALPPSPPGLAVSVTSNHSTNAAIAAMHWFAGSALREVPLTVADAWPVVEASNPDAAIRLTWSTGVPPSLLKITALATRPGGLIADLTPRATIRCAAKGSAFTRPCHTRSHSERSIAVDVPSADLHGARWLVVTALWNIVPAIPVTPVGSPSNSLAGTFMEGIWTVRLS
jgi:hypothetical protein